MNRPIRTIAATLAIACAAPAALTASAHAAPRNLSVEDYRDFQTGMRNFHAGRYEIAHDIWMDLARDGVAEAQYNLGRMYAYGEGVKLDRTEAYAWFILSARNGRDADARRAQAQIRPFLDPDQISAAYERALALQASAGRSRPLYEALGRGQVSGNGGEG